MGDRYATSPRLPGLDGIRAIAVLMVVWSHMANFPGFPVFRSSSVDFARLGVTVFFVLSGFLITTLLVDERSRKGRISLRDFYLRRTIRIFPAAYLYIGVVVVFAWLGLATRLPGDLQHAVTYTMNYHHERGWSLGHLWSLALEEQFYLLWPLIFLLARKGAILVALSVVVLAPVVRALAWILWPAERTGIDEEFQYVADSLATGCLLALLVARFGGERIAGMVPRWMFLAAPAAAVVATFFTDYPSFHLPFGMTLINVGIALSILWVVNRPATVVGCALNSRAAVFVGTISYSLYLWQQLFLNPQLMTMRYAVPIAVVLSFAAAIASYYLVEKPLLGLRERFRH